MERYELKCKAHQVRVTDTVEYDQNGNVAVSESTPRAKWKDAVPESVGEGILKSVCKRNDR
jgi:hypothetical protein